MGKLQLENWVGERAEIPGLHVTRTHRRYAPVSAAASILGISEEMIRVRLGQGSIKTLPRPTGVLVCLDDLELEPGIHARLTAEIKVDSRGYYEDQEGKWCTATAFFESLDEAIKARTTPQAVLLQAQMYCRSKEAVDRHGRSGTKIYLYDELFDKALALLRIGKIINPHTRHTVDESGTKWGSKRFWIDFFQISNHALDKGVKNAYGIWERVPNEPGRNSIIRHGKINLQKGIPVFSEPTIRIILSYILDAKNKIENGVYKVINETSGKVEAVYHSANRLSREIPLHRDYIHSKLMKMGCPHQEGIDRRSGADVTVFEITRAREIFKDQIEVVTTTDDDGEFRDDTYGRCVTIERYCEEKDHIKRDHLEDLIEEHRPTRLRRRDQRNNQIVFLYPEKDLDRISRAA